MSPDEKEKLASMIGILFYAGEPFETNIAAANIGIPNFVTTADIAWVRQILEENGVVLKNGTFIDKQLSEVKIRLGLNGNKSNQQRISRPDYTHPIDDYTSLLFGLFLSLPQIEAETEAFRKFVAYQMAHVMAIELRAYLKPVRSPEWRRAVIKDYLEMSFKKTPSGWVLVWSLSQEGLYKNHRQLQNASRWFKKDLKINGEETSVKIPQRLADIIDFQSKHLKIRFQRGAGLAIMFSHEREAVISFLDRYASLLLGSSDQSASFLFGSDCQVDWQKEDLFNAIGNFGRLRLLARSDPRAGKLATWFDHKLYRVLGAKFWNLQRFGSATAIIQTVADIDTVIKNNIRSIPRYLPLTRVHSALPPALRINALERNDYVAFANGSYPDFWNSITSAENEYSLDETQAIAGKDSLGNVRTGAYGEVNSIELFSDLRFNFETIDGTAYGKLPDGLMTYPAQGKRITLPVEIKSSLNATLPNILTAISEAHAQIQGYQRFHKDFTGGAVWIHLFVESDQFAKLEVLAAKLELALSMNVLPPLPGVNVIVIRAHLMRDNIAIDDFLIFTKGRYSQFVEFSDDHPLVKKLFERTSLITTEEHDDLRKARRPSTLVTDTDIDRLFKHTEKLVRDLALKTISWRIIEQNSFRQLMKTYANLLVSSDTNLSSKAKAAVGELVEHQQKIGAANFEQDDLETKQTMYLQMSESAITHMESLLHAISISEVSGISKDVAEHLQSIRSLRIYLRWAHCSQEQKAAYLAEGYLILLHNYWNHVQTEDLLVDNAHKRREAINMALTTLVQVFRTDNGYLKSVIAGNNKLTPFVLFILAEIQIETNLDNGIFIPKKFRAEWKSILKSCTRIRTDISFVGFIPKISASSDLKSHPGIEAIRAEFRPTNIVPVKTLFSVPLL